MNNLGRAYDLAGVRPGDIVIIKSYGFRLRGRVVSPQEAFNKNKKLCNDGNSFIYVEHLDGKHIGSFTGFPVASINRVEIPNPPPAINLKRQNDTGGNNGKCVQCSGKLKSWMPNRFHCPVCEP